MAQTHDLCIYRSAFTSKAQARFSFQKKTSFLTLPQLCMLMNAVLQEKVFSKERVINIVRYHILRNETAYRSHRKTTIEKLFTKTNLRLDDAG